MKYLTNYFKYQKEEMQNPYIGFMSFQHFRGDKLYSDVVVKPENNMTETEDLECYPIPDYVPQNGREEGWYPDTTIAYFRVLWKEFEPIRGVYNYKLIEEILEKANACGQMVAFRLLPHSTRASDDVPDWLKEMIPCPERPAGKRVKDSPTAPEFLELFENAIRKFGEHFDSNPVLYSMDICLPGAWGEGHNLHLYSDEALKGLMDTFLEAFKETQLIGQLFKPWVIHYGNKVCPVGWRGDGLGFEALMEKHYPDRISQMPEIWKKAPISFEAYWWLGEWKRKGWDIDNIIEKTLSWHISSFNPKSLPIPYEWRDKMIYWISKMGYHFSLDYFKYPVKGSASDTLEFELGVDNCGVAPIYRNIPVKIRLINEQNVYLFDTDIDIREWMPGKSVNNVTISLPEDMQPGNYDVEIGVFGEDTPMIYLCTNAPRNDKYYRVGEVTVV